MRVPGTQMHWRQFLRALGRELKDDNVVDVAAAVAFFGILALFPFLLFLVALASVLIDVSTAESLIGSLEAIAPAAVTDILGERIRALGERSSTGLLTLGAALALWTASGGAMALMRALNRAFGVTESRPFWKTRGIALLVTLAVAVLGLLAALITVVTPIVVEALGGGWGGVLVRALRIPIAGLLVSILWALLFYFLPNTRRTLRVFSPGSLVGVVLWLAVSWAFSFYVANFGNYDATYGAIGGVIVLLLWMLLSVLAFLLGAEINDLVFKQRQKGKAGA
ncbi:MAG: YihY/virulence factor BrkB family protein [Myxococcales bacterium]|jgi:membrane protein